MSEQKSDLINFRQIFRGYLKKWYWFVISVVFCLLVGIFYCTRIHPLYEVRASVQLNEDISATSMLAGGLSGVSEFLGGNSSGEDEILIMSSHSSLRDIARKLELNKTHYKRLMPTVYVEQPTEYPVEVRPVESTINVDTLRTALFFAIKAKPDGRTKLTMKVGGETYNTASVNSLPATFATDYGTFIIEKTPFYPEGETCKTQVILCGYDQAAENLRQSLNIALASKHSQIINLQAITPTPKKTAKVLDAVIEHYNNRALSDRLDQNNATTAFLTERLEGVRRNLDKSDAEVRNFKQAAGITSLSADAEALAERMHESEQKVVQQQTSVEMAKVTLDMVRASATDNSLLPYHSGSETIAALIKTYNNLILQRIQLEASVKGRNTTLDRLDEQIAAIRANLIETLESAVSRGEELLAQYKKYYNEARAQVTDIPSQELDFRNLTRQRTIEEQLYTFLLQKREETGILLNELNAKGKIVDRAYIIDEDVSTSKASIIILALLFGLLIPPVIIYIQEHFLTRKPKDADED